MKLESLNDTITESFLSKSVLAASALLPFGVGASDSVPQSQVKSQTVSDGELYNFIRLHEGVNDRAYRCTAGKLTIGIGCNLERTGIEKLLQSVGVTDVDGVKSGSARLTGQQIEKLFAYDLKIAKQDALKNVPNLYDHPAAVQKVIIDMAFNLGGNKLSKFVKFREALKNYDYNKAADEMVNSKWYKDVKNRAVENVSLIRQAVKHRNIIKTPEIKPEIKPKETPKETPIKIPAEIKLQEIQKTKEPIIKPQDIPTV